MQAYDLADIFESIEKFNNKGFAVQEKRLLSEYLLNNATFKKRRMLQLLSVDVHCDDMAWLEWFNWYYQGVSFSECPAWLQNEKGKLSLNDIKLMSYPNLTDLGWEIKDVVKSSIDISAAGIGNYIPTEHELEHWVKLRRQNMDLFTGAVLAGELVAQVGFIKITAAEHQKISAGKLSENSLSGLCDDSSDEIFLYIPSVVIKRELQKKTLLMKMLKHLFQQFNNSAIGPKVKGFIAVAYTKDGEKLCQQFNLSYKTSNLKDQKVYSGTIDDLLQSKLCKKICR